MAWEGNPILQPFHAVPDSCCIHPREGCGHDIFKAHSLKKMAEYVKKIHVHGCLHAMEQVLKVSKDKSQIFYKSRFLFSQTIIFHKSHL